MKGFPNQVAELTKIATGIERLTALVDQGADAKNDGVFGESLVHAGVAGTGHSPIPVLDYLREQRKKPIGGQSFRTTARGFRELYRKLNFIDDAGDEVRVTPLGRRAADFAEAAMNAAQVAFWQRVVRNIIQADAAGVSHPYLVLLRLVARKPGISRAKCALALEAHDDSDEELDRIVALADLSEQQIVTRIKVTRSNWDNAKKVLPKFAQQLGDVIERAGGFYIADAPGSATEAGEPARGRAAERRPAGTRTPRSSREVTPDTIGKAGIAERDEEFEPLPADLDPAAMAAAIKMRRARLKRHNLLVRAFATLLKGAGAQLFEDPFDILGLIAKRGFLVEVKSLDGSEADERDRVRDALAQLLYYEGFVTRPVAGEATIRKIACFENKISDAHIAWLNAQSIAAIWKDEDAFAGDDLAGEFLGRYLREFR